MFVIERFEDDYVLCEEIGSCELIWFPKEIFPPHTYEGMTVEIIDNKARVLANSELEERIEKKMRQLWN